MAERIDTLANVTGGYDAILCDVWGVLHNGVDAFAPASEALTAARAAGVTVVLITNSPPTFSDCQLLPIGDLRKW